ncbi:MAG: hypothetical protein HY329_16125 [Chloroflexi bacterium]|nr:hypothetical protein [Chloroflexota bacterium]
MTATYRDSAPESAASAADPNLAGRVTARLQTLLQSYTVALMAFAQSLFADPSDLAGGSDRYPSDADLETILLLRALGRD